MHVDSRRSRNLLSCDCTLSLNCVVYFDTAFVYWSGGAFVLHSFERLYLFVQPSHRVSVIPFCVIYSGLIMNCFPNLYFLFALIVFRIAYYLTNRAVGVIVSPKSIVCYILIFCKRGSCLHDLSNCSYGNVA